MLPSPIAPTGAVRTDDAGDAYRTERAGAQLRADRVARTPPTPFQRVYATRAAALPVSAAQRPRAPADHTLAPSADLLHDDYTAHCLKLAVQAFHAQLARLDARTAAANQAVKDEQTRLEARAEAEHDLGTIDALLLLQSYRNAAGIPAVLAPALPAVTGAPPLTVAPVAAAAKTRSAAEHAGVADYTPRKPRKPIPNDLSQ
ncbi:hypothetical protein [Achromobacter spanius]|uniref:Uncharacterized protein n=1 Tax=Achromobacter spanius TaxID=217203 RepID=A0A2S0I8J1_9BURK|nr:hypothetical protein [Achromobacter spanius]AVJ28332.1 hypothetical protein CLM73_15105 [Achromobacter spanius]